MRDHRRKHHGRSISQADASCTAPDVRQRQRETPSFASRRRRRQMEDSRLLRHHREARSRGRATAASRISTCVTSTGGRRPFSCREEIPRAPAKGAETAPFRRNSPVHRTTAARSSSAPRRTLTAADGDGQTDIYARDIAGATTGLVSTPGTCPAGLPPDQNCDPVFGGTSNDGSHVFFETNEQIAAGDEDAALPTSMTGRGGDRDPCLPRPRPQATAITTSPMPETRRMVRRSTSPTDEALVGRRRRSGSGCLPALRGVTTLVSTGPEGGNGSLAIPASFKWASPDGSSPAVIFTTAEALDAADKDSIPGRLSSTAPAVPRPCSRRAPKGATATVDAESSPAASDDGSRVFFSTAEPLFARRRRRERRHLPCGRAPRRPKSPAGPAQRKRRLLGAGLRGASRPTAPHVFFTTRLSGSPPTTTSTRTRPTSTSHARAERLLVSIEQLAQPLGPAPPPQLSTAPTRPRPANPSTTPSIIGQADRGHG